MSEQMFAQLLELVGSAGEGGFVLAVIYLMGNYFIGVVWLCIIFIVGRFVTGIVNNLSIAREIGEIIGFTWHGELSSSEKFDFLTKVRQLVDRSKDG